jgi:hypothetical protein
MFYIVTITWANYGNTTIKCFNAKKTALKWLNVKLRRGNVREFKYEEKEKKRGSVKRRFIL